MNVDVEDFIRKDFDLAVLIEQAQTTAYLMVFRESSSAPDAGVFSADRPIPSRSATVKLWGIASRKELRYLAVGIRIRRGGDFENPLTWIP